MERPSVSNTEKDSSVAPPPPLPPPAPRLQSPNMSSGIDWSIFRDGEDDTFAWLWRTTPTTPSFDVASQLPGQQASQVAMSSLEQTDVNRLVAQLQRPQQQHTSFPGAYSAPPAASVLQMATPSARPVLTIDDDGADDHDAIMISSDGGQSTPQGGTLGQDSAAGKGKRQGKRRKTGANAVDEEDKKQLRRVKNLASVREFRKRKMKQVEENEVKLRRLEAENMDLKMRLKIGKDALVTEQQEKQAIKEQMRELLQQGASEQEVARFLNMYKTTYSDYGPKRREKLQFHLSRIRELLLPTQVTKLCLYSVEQGSEMIARDQEVNDDHTSVSDAGMAPMSLWGILAKELNVSEAQQRQILERRASITKIRDGLNHTLGIVKQLEQVTEDKNTALESQIAELQNILTPSQATKFIIWVKENPAFMYMLDKLVDSTLMGTVPATESTS